VLQVDGIIEFNSIVRSRSVNGSLWLNSSHDTGFFNDGTFTNKLFGLFAGRDWLEVDEDDISLDAPNGVDKVIIDNNGVEVRGMATDNTPTTLAGFDANDRLVKVGTSGYQNDTGKVRAFEAWTQGANNLEIHDYRDLQTIPVDIAPGTTPGSSSRGTVIRRIPYSFESVEKDLLILVTLSFRGAGFIWLTMGSGSTNPNFGNDSNREIIQSAALVNQTTDYEATTTTLQFYLDASELDFELKKYLDVRATSISGGNFQVDFGNWDSDPNTTIITNQSILNTLPFVNNHTTVPFIYDPSPGDELYFQKSKVQVSFIEIDILTKDDGSAI
jgi:hypothetical protein